MLFAQKRKHCRGNILRDVPITMFPCNRNCLNCYYNCDEFYKVAVVAVTIVFSTSSVFFFSFENPYENYR